ncbi:MAG: ATP synthase F0 subunit B [Candidatus Aminicenantes bacterium]|nr:ATP synthase F0 subunit B [Candidatus Aminicenantes bacterium]
MTKGKTKLVTLSAFLFLGWACLFLLSSQMPGQEHSSTQELQTQHAVSAEGEHPERHGSGSSGFIGKVLNFLILFGGLAFILRKPMSRFLRERIEGVKVDLEETRSSRKEKQKNLKNIHNRLKKVAEEARSIKQEAENIGKKDRERILQEASIEAVRLKESAKQDIELLSQFGIQELKAYTAEVAVTIAREKIRKNMRPESQAILIDRSIKKLETLYEKSGSS